MAPSLPAGLRPALRALAETFVPETAEATESDWAALESVLTAALTTRPPSVQRQTFLFIRLLDAIALLRHGRRLAQLSPTLRRRLIEGIGNAPVLLLRRGVWGLRTLVMMGWYGRPEVQRAIGYRARAAGWEARA